MTTYDVQMTSHAEKDLKKMDRTAAAKAREVLQLLKRDPQAGHLLSGSLKKVRSLEFSAPGKAYRATYFIEGRTCIVFAIGPHENFYDLVTRRFQSLKVR